MSIVRRRILATAIGFLTLVPACGLQAQDSAGSACSGLADPEAEIACLRQALADSQRALGEARGSKPAERVQQVVRSPAAPAAPVEELGAEQLTASAQPDQRETEQDAGLRAVVLAASVDPRGLLIVRLDNGQSWQQIEPSGVPLRGTWVEHQAVEIGRSGFGGYRLRFPKKGRQFAVRRIQ